MTTTSLRCKFCDRLCGNPQGLAAHVRSMHPAEFEAEVAAARAGHEAPPAPPTANGLVWEDPPPKRQRGAEVYDEILAFLPQLRRNPGRWARLYTWKNPSAASPVKQRLETNHAEAVADIEFVARRTGKELSALYGRFTGE